MGMEGVGKGRKEKKENMRWIWKLDGRTPGYLVREEEKREKMRLRLGRRAME